MICGSKSTRFSGRLGPLRQRGFIMVRDRAKLGKPFNVQDLFRAGEQGYWYDTQDLSSMYADNLGAAPATAPGQGVADCSIGMRLDKRFGLVRNAERVTTLVASGANTTSVGGTVTFTAAGVAEFASQSSILTVGAWYEVRFTVASISSGAVSAGDGLLTASISAPGSYSYIQQATTTGFSIRARSGSQNTAVVNAISVKQVPGNHATQATAGSRPTLSARYNLLVATAALSTQSVTVLAASHVLSFTGTGTVTLSGTSTAGPLVGTGANNRVSLTFTPTAGTLTLTVTGSVTLADLRLADDAAKAIPAYQAVTSATTYDTSGFPWYLKCDGFDDGMVTNTIDFTGTDKMTVWAGSGRLNDVAQGLIIGLGATDAGAGAGTFGVYGPSGAANGHFSALLRGDTNFGGKQQTAAIAAPCSAVLSVAYDIAGATITTETVLRSSGVEQTTEVGAIAGSGNFSSNPIYLFRRGGSSLPFNGRDYGQIVRGAASTASQIANAERYLARNMGLAI